MRLSSHDQEILRIAIPSIVSNITVPLLGLVDVAITGHLGAASYIAAISIGGMVFNTTYWIFGFLRMGSSGLTAQALGRHDFQEVTLWLERGLQLALLIGVLLILLQWPIRETALWLMRPSEEVRQLVITYFNICIWGAPAMLGLYAMNGWFIGMQNSRIPMVTAIVQNSVNIIASLMLVFVFGMKVEGVALGTLIAQWTGFLLAIVLYYHFYEKRHHSVITLLRDNRKRNNMITLLRNHETKRFFQINRDIFLRTLCLVSVMLFFTSAGSWQGEVILAVNTLLMQLYLLVSYVMDGFANAAEAMSGKYWGAGNTKAFRDTVWCCFLWGGCCAAVFTLLYMIGGDAFLGLLTDEPTVVETSHTYVWWAYLIPVCSVGAFIWDGIYIGITGSREMFLSSLVAALMFFLLYYFLRDTWGNHGLWLAMTAFLLIRGILLTGFYRKKLSLLRSSCAPGDRG
jgi:MATE family multidrug resistance protein